MKTGKLLIWLFTFVFMCPLHMDAKKVKYSSHMYYEGDVSGGKPNGEGILYCTLNKIENFGSGLVRFMTDKNYDPLTAQKAKDGVCDMIKGTFSDTHVSNATVLFNSGWKYVGNLSFDPTNDDYVVFSFDEGGILVAPSTYNSNFINPKVVIAKPFTIKRFYETFKFDCSNISLWSKPNLKKNKDLTINGIPINYLIENNYLIELRLSQVVNNKKEEFDWNSVFGQYINEKLDFIVITKPNNNYSYIYKTRNGNYYRTNGVYHFALPDGNLDKKEDSSDIIISYKNGDKFVGKAYFIDRASNKLVNDPSFDPTSSCYIESLTLANSIKAYTGLYTRKDGSSYRLIKGKTEEEIMIETEARQEEQRAAQAKAAAAKKASAAKINEAKKQLASVQHGKTYYFNCYYTPYSGNWDVTHGNASIRFYANGQDILLRVGGSLTYLHFSEITKDGDLSCYETNNPLYGTWYITILTVNGKKAFKLRRPVMGIQYLLKNPSKVGY